MAEPNVRPASRRFARTAAAAALLLSLGIAPLRATAQDIDFSKVEIKVHRVAGNVYMLEGAGGNIGVSVGDDGIVIVDDQYAPLAAKIRAALQTIADKPVRYVINTHWHPDHTGGNEAISKEATVLAQENVRARMKAGTPAVTFGGRELPATPPAANAALPLITFDQKLTVHLNGEDIRAIHLRPGHTDGDCAVFFTKSNVVHTGDDFVRMGFPFIDLRSGGSIRGYLANLDQLIAEIPPGAKIIPGHGDVGTVDDLKAFAKTMKEVVGKIEAELKRGKDAEAIKKAGVLKQYDQAWGQGFIKTDNFIDIVVADLSAKAKPAKATK